MIQPTAEDVASHIEDSILEPDGSFWTGGTRYPLGLKDETKLLVFVDGTTDGASFEPAYVFLVKVEALSQEEYELIRKAIIAEHSSARESTS